MSRLTPTQATRVARQIEIQLKHGNFAAADEILARCVAEVKRSRRRLCQTYVRPSEVPLAQLKLDACILDALESCELTTVGDLQHATYDDLLTIPNLGPARVALLRDCLRQLLRDFETRAFEQAL